MALSARPYLQKVPARFDPAARLDQHPHNVPSLRHPEPILRSYPNAKILRFDADTISGIAYQDTEHYAVTRDFLNHYPRRLQQLPEPDYDTAKPPRGAGCC